MRTVSTSGGLASAAAMARMLRERASSPAPTDSDSERAEAAVRRKPLPRPGTSPIAPALPSTPPPSSSIRTTSERRRSRSFSGHEVARALKRDSDYALPDQPPLPSTPPPSKLSSKLSPRRRKQLAEKRAEVERADRGRDSDAGDALLRALQDAEAHSVAQEDTSRKTSQARWERAKPRVDAQLSAAEQQLASLHTSNE